MYTVSQVARAIDVSVSTVRQWSGEFAEFLSDSADPPKGTTRRYDDEDVATLQTVAVLRDRLVEYDEIHERLQQGERLEPGPGEREPEPEPEEEAPPGSSDTALVTESFAQALKAYEGQIGTLQNRVEELTDKLVDAEKRAASAETEARLLRERLEAENARKGEISQQGASQEPEEGRAWWQFWKR